MGILDNIKKTLGGRKSSGDVPAEVAEGKAAMPATYTVQSGDTLWKIASRVYGDGSQYPKIFEANRAVLKQPEHIFPGQQLVIPPPGD